MNETVNEDSRPTDCGCEYVEMYAQSDPETPVRTYCAHYCENHEYKSTRT